MAINIEVITDVGAAVAGVGTLADRYDDVSDTLKDLAVAGDNAGRDLERALEAGSDQARDFTRTAGRAENATEDLGDAGRTAGRELGRGLETAEDATRDLERRADAAFDAISDNARASGRSVARTQVEAFEEASEGAQEFGDEAQSTARETAASFDGSADSILGAFQEVAANAFAGFGPAGALAGLAVAAGIGIAVTKMQDLAEENDSAQEAVIELAAKFEEAGGRIEDVDYAGIIRDWGREVQGDNWLTFWVDEAESNFQKYADYAKQAGVSTQDAVRGMKGTAEDSQGFLDGTTAEWERLTKVIAAGTHETAQGGRVMNATAKDANTKREALDELRKGSQENLDVTAEAIEIYGIEKDVLGEVAQTAEEAADAIKAKADATAQAAGAAMDVVTAENDWIETLDQMTKDIATNGAQLDANTQAGRDNRSSLVDLAESANGYRDAAIGAGEGADAVTAKVQASRDAFIVAAEAAGYNGTEAAKLADSYGLIPGNVATQVAAYGTEETKAAIESIPAATDTTVTVTEAGAGEAQAKIDGVTGTTAEVKTEEKGAAQAQKTIDAVKGKEVEVKVTDKGSTAAVQKSIDGLRGRDLSVNLVIGNERDFLNAIDRLTANRSLEVTVNERKGKGVV